MGTGLAPTAVPQDKAAVEITELTTQQGGDILMYGFGPVAKTLLAHDLVAGTHRQGMEEPTRIALGGWSNRFFYPEMMTPPRCRTAPGPSAYSEVHIGGDGLGRVTARRGR